jgi:NADPH:quinone reductase-like Zn-dependent oxidoreductase
MLKIAAHPLRAPLPGEARIRVLATPVCQDDVAARVGNRPFLVKTPFVPGYTVLGIVDAVGDGVTAVAVGDRVAALTKVGGYTEVIYLAQDQLVHVPAGLDPAEAVVLILNYLVAYQVLHRVARVHPGDTALIVGASGGVGTAFLQLGQLAGLRMYGLASRSKHAVLAAYGAVPIDYRTEDVVKVMGAAEPAGLDFVFNGMGTSYIPRGMAILRRGGMLVQYGAPESFARFLLLMAQFGWYNAAPNGKTVKGYGTHRGASDEFREDWSKLFGLLASGQIRPVITHRYPLLDAANANALLESGKVSGNIVLLAPEVLQ